MPNYSKMFKNIITENMFMNIATSDIENNPWVSNVFYSYDSKMNFYWGSPHDSRHSQNITANSRIAINIYNSTYTNEEIDAVYLTANAYEITNILEIIKILPAYTKRLYKFKLIKKSDMSSFMKSAFDFQNESPLRFYKAATIEKWKLAPIKLYKDKILDERIRID